MARIPYLHAMRAQPDALAVARDAIVRSLDAGPLPSWTAGSTLAVLAMGASRNSGYALAAVLAEAGVRAVNPAASELERTPDLVPGDLHLVVSESGRSPEPLEVARRLPVGTRIGITNFPEAQIRDTVDAVVDLGGIDDSGVYTAGYTATLMAYALLLDRLGVLPAAGDVARLPQIVGRALQRYADVADAVATAAMSATSVDVVGQGASFAAAAEFALMIREGLRVPASAWETFEYLHGPMESVSESTLTVLFGDGRETEVPRHLLDGGSRAVLVTAAEAAVDGEGEPGLTVVRIDPGEGPFTRPILEIVVAQLVLGAATERLPFSVDDFVFTELGTKLAVQA